jgi:hypothetical protein
MKPRSGLILVRSRPTFSVRGLRPTAIRIFSASIFCCAPATVMVTATPAFVFSTLSTFALVWKLMPRLRKHFDDCHFAVERAVDRGELYSYRSCADDDQGFREVFQAEDFDVGEHAVVRFEAGQHTGFGAGGENHVLGF